jgi:hypothetical protein
MVGAFDTYPPIEIDPTVLNVDNVPEDTEYL